MRDDQSQPVPGQLSDHLLRCRAAFGSVKRGEQVGEFDASTEEIAQMTQENQEIIGTERRRDDIRLLTDKARQSPQKTLVGYLAAQREDLAQRIANAERGLFDDEDDVQRAASDDRKGEKKPVGS